MKSRCPSIMIPSTMPEILRPFACAAMVLAAAVSLESVMKPTVDSNLCSLSHRRQLYVCVDSLYQFIEEK
jgi:hypothetical protein